MNELTVSKVLGDIVADISRNSTTFVNSDKEIRPYSLDEISKIYQRGNALPTTDLEAKRYINKIVGGKLVYVAEPGEIKGTWYFWDGTRYAPTKEAVDTKLVTALADDFQNFLKAVKAALAGKDLGKDDSEKMTKYLFEIQKMYRYFADAKGVRNMTFTLRNEPVDPTKFEVDTDYIVMSDGRVILTDNLTGGILNPSPERFVSRKLNVSLDGKATQPEWFLKTMEEWGMSKEEIEYLQLNAGCAILGKGGAKNIPTIFGRSHTAKSTYVEIMVGIFGSYAGKLGQGGLVERGVNFEQHTARAKRFVYVEEPKTGKMDDAFFKGFANGIEGATVETQRKGRDLEEWPVQGVLHIITNKIPEMDFQDDAIVGRIDIIECTKVYAPGAPGTDKLIGQKILAAEGPAILRWILDGAVKFLANGKEIQKPESVKKRALDNVAESSVALQWLMEKIEEGDFKEDLSAPVSAFVPISKELYNMDFELWCATNGIHMKDKPTRKEWAAEIQRYMKQPSSEAKKRPGGHARFWGIVPVQKRAQTFAQNAQTPFETSRGHATWRQPAS